MLEAPIFSIRLLPAAYLLGLGAEIGPELELEPTLNVDFLLQKLFPGPALLVDFLLQKYFSAPTWLERRAVTRRAVSEDGKIEKTRIFDDAWRGLEGQDCVKGCDPDGDLKASSPCRITQLGEQSD